MTSKITFIIPNRGGKHIDFVINQLKKYWPNEEYIVINQEDNEPFKRGQLFNIASNYVNTEYLCFIDNDLFFKQKIDLIGEYNKGCQILMPFNIIEQVEIKGDSYKTTKTGKAITLEGDNRFGTRGGISFISKNMFIKLNGYSNLLIGYGYEDNEFACRCDKNGFKNMKNIICHITHPTRDTKNLHQQLNCVLFNNENKHSHGGLNETIYDEVFCEVKNGVKYIGVTNISSSNKDTQKLLDYHKPENIRKSCEYMCDYYIKKYITSNYVLIGVPKHMNIGDTLIWQAEKELLDKLPYKRIATFFFGTYTHHIKISPNDTIVFSGGGYLNDVWGGSIEYVNTILETFPNNKVVFLPNSVYRINDDNKEFKRLIKNFKYRKIKPVLMSREYQSIRKARWIFSNSVEHVLVPDVVLTWDVKKYMKEHNITNESGKGILFIDRKDKERISNIDFSYNDKSDWQQMNKRPSYANEKTRCADWESNVKDRLIIETIEWVKKYEKIYSNRMHGAILAWLLGKETYLINNSYGKSKSLYETWLLDDIKIQMI